MRNDTRRFLEWRKAKLHELVERMMFGVEDVDSIVPNIDADNAPLELESESGE